MCGEAFVHPLEIGRVVHAVEHSGAGSGQQDEFDTVDDGAVRSGQLDRRTRNVDQRLSVAGIGGIEIDDLADAFVTAIRSTGDDQRRSEHLVAVSLQETLHLGVAPAAVAAPVNQHKRRHIALLARGWRTFLSVRGNHIPEPIWSNGHPPRLTDLGFGIGTPIREVGGMSDQRLKAT